MTLGWRLRFESLFQVCTSLCLTEQSVDKLRSLAPNVAINKPPDEALNHAPAVTCHDYVIEALLQTIEVSVRAHAKQYSAQELERTVTLVCFLALDASIIKHDLHFAVERVLSALLESFAQDAWQASSKTICQHCSRLTSFHHNMAHLSSIWPPSVRGQCMQRMLATTFLQQLVDKSESCSVNDNVQVCSCSCLILRLKHPIIAEIFCGCF